MLAEQGLTLDGPVVDALVSVAADVYRPHKHERADAPAVVGAPLRPPTPHQELTAAVALVCHLVAGSHAGKAAAELEAAIPERDPDAIRQMARDVVELYSPDSWWYRVRCAGLANVQPPSPDTLVRTIGLALEWKRAGARAPQVAAPMARQGGRGGGWPGAR